MGYLYGVGILFLAYLALKTAWKNEGAWEQRERDRKATMKILADGAAEKESLQRTVDGLKQNPEPTDFEGAERRLNLEE